MELLSNLVWVVVAVAFWGLWLANLYRTRGKSLRPGIGAQMASLAVLTLILLPVISVSDDLRASHNPAEVERTSIRTDRHLVQPDAAPNVPAALAIVITYLLFVSPQRMAFLRRPADMRNERIACLRVAESRPPPAV